MKSAKITKDKIITGASFELKNGTYTIIEIEKDGYKKGSDRIRTKMGDNTYCDDYTSVLWFINSNIK